MDCFIGIDGGGTKTLLRAVDSQKNMLCEIMGGGTNIYSLGEEAVRINVDLLLRECLSKLPPNSIIKGICLGSAGVVGEENRKALHRMIRNIAHCDCIIVTNDAVTALYAELKGIAGISVTSGTGSICLAKDSEGNLARCGGWGHLFSDEGSAYSIALQALSRVSKAHDGRMPPTSLTEQFLSYFQTAFFDEMIERIYRNHHTKKEMASLAVLVDAAANDGDPAALSILSDAAEELYQMCETTVKQLKIENAPLLVIMNGSTLLKNKMLAGFFISKMKKTFPKSRIQPGGKDAAWGALYYLDEKIEGFL